MIASRPVFVVVTGALLAASACDDVSPLAYRPPPRDAEVPDRVDLAQAAACRACATDDGATCRPGLDSCQAANPVCGELLRCLTDTDCWRKLNPKNFGDPPPCAAGCLESAHVTSINEIGAPATDFYLCIIDEARCAPVCMDPPKATTGDQ